jgi:hypothetical protein
LTVSNGGPQAPARKYVGVQHSAGTVDLGQLIAALS